VGFLFLEATMQSSLFIETSNGHINLSLVTHIYEHAGELVFQFERSMVSLPRDEGKKLMALLLPLMRERFMNWQMGVLK
jgi:hypothetical protein